MRKIAISDIHGCNRTFRALLHDVIKLQIDDELYLLGDFIDRGPDSKGVMDYIFQLQERGFIVKCLLGNHEKMMTNHQYHKTWMNAGGEQVLESFNIDKINYIPQKYLDFTEKLPDFLIVDNYILVHAGLDFSLKNPLATATHKNQRIWIRHWYNNINYAWLENRIIIHGHTPTTKNEIEVDLALLDKNQYINIDAGCFMNNEVGRGFLCAFDMTNKKTFFQKNIDDMSSWQNYRNRKARI